MQISVTKRYQDFPASHRQPNHPGHCSKIHGHNWDFELTFECEVLNEVGFVVDFGKLKPIKVWLESFFDHTLLLNADDPIFKTELGNLLNDFADIVEVPDCGCEGLAQYVFKNINEMIEQGELDMNAKERGVRCVKVTVYEDRKNSATYEK